MHKNHALALTFLFLTITTILSAQQSTFLRFGYGIGQRSNTANYESKTIHGYNFEVGYSYDSFYGFIGSRFHQRQSSSNCLAPQINDSLSLQIFPSPFIEHPEDSGLCEYSRDNFRRVLEIPIGIGYIFSKNKKLQYYLEVATSPLIRQYVTRTTVELATNQTIHGESTDWFKFEPNIMLRSGISKEIYDRLHLNLGLFYKSYDKNLNNVQYGLDFRFNYIFSSL